MDLVIWRLWDGAESSFDVSLWGVTAIIIAFQFCQCYDFGSDVNRALKCSAMDVDKDGFINLGMLFFVDRYSSSHFEVLP